MKKTYISPSYSLKQVKARVTLLSISYNSEKEAASDATLYAPGMDADDIDLE